MTNEVQCEWCGNDLTTSGPVTSYRINLRSITIPNEGGYCIDVLIYPQFEKPLNFCGKGCLRLFINKDFENELKKLNPNSVVSYINNHILSESHDK